MSYRVFNARGRPLLATPAGPRKLRLAAVRRLHPVSRRRRIYQLCVQAAVLLGLDGLFARTADGPLRELLGATFPDWLAAAAEAVGERRVNAAVLWPPEPHRGRVYVHLFNERCQAVGFAKLSTREDGGEALKRETRVLAELTGIHSREWRVPRVLSHGRFRHSFFVLLEALPESARPIPARPDAYPEKCVSAFGGSPRWVRGADLPELSWWHAYRDRLDERCAAFDRELIETAADGFAVCRAHGDFGPSNIFRAGDVLWILDWENSAPDAPIATDEITFDLGIRAGRAAADPAATLRDLARRRLADGGRRARCDLLLALAFRSTVAEADAARLIRAWDTVS